MIYSNDDVQKVIEQVNADSDLKSRILSHLNVVDRNAVCDVLQDGWYERFDRYDSDVCENFLLYYEKEKDVVNSKEQIVLLTGLPVSDEMKKILELCENGQYVSIENIKNTAEMKTAASCVSHQTPTILLKDREQIEENIYRKMCEYGSISVDEDGKPKVDKDGNKIYNESIERGSRLDIVIGLPASGKSSAIVDKISKEHHSMLIDNDEAKRMFPEFNKGWGSSVVHDESKKVEKDVFFDMILECRNIVLPKVGSDANKLLKDYILPAKRKGYTVNIHFATLDRNKALGRMINRYINTGRYLEPEVIDKYVNKIDGNKIDKAFNELKKNDNISGYSKWSTDVPYGKDPILLEYKGLTDKFIMDRVDAAKKDMAEFMKEGANEYGKQSIARTNGRRKNVR